MSSILMFDASVNLDGCGLREECIDLMCHSFIWMLAGFISDVSASDPLRRPFMWVLLGFMVAGCAE